MLVKSRPKFITLGILGAMMALLIVGLMYSQGTAQANDGSETNVATGANVVPTGAAPVFECKWELPDMQDKFSDATVPDNRIQYNLGAGNHTHDDAVTLPSTTPACFGPPTTLPGQADGIMNMIQVMPLPHLSPLDVVPRREIQLWAAVDHPNGINNIDDVFWKIYHPDGTFKIQVHGTKIGVSDDAVLPSDGEFGHTGDDAGGMSLPGYDHNNDVAFGTDKANNPNMQDFERRIAECAQLGTSTANGTMFEAAVHTGQVSAQAIDDKNKGMVSKCQQGEKAIYYAMFDIVKDQPCGKYKIEANAIANGNLATPLINYIDILCFWYLNTDFTGLSWGAITPGSMQVISGDFIWDNGGDASPNGQGATVHNGGNHPMGIKIHFTTMWQDVANGPKFIDKFDACFGKTPSTLECVGQSTTLDAFGIPVDAIMASEWTGFGPNPGNVPATSWNGDFDQVLCANDLGKLDLSIHPYQILPMGTYIGDFDLMAHTVHTLDDNGAFCAGDQEHLAQ